MRHVWDHSGQEQGNLLVLLALSDFADDNGRAYPSVATLSKKARLSTRQVQRAIRELEAADEIRIEPNAGRNGVNVYVVNSAAAVPKEPATGEPVTPDKLSPPTKCQGDTHVTGGVTPTSPEPSVEPSVVIPQSPSPSASEVVLASKDAIKRKRASKPKQNPQMGETPPDPRFAPVTRGYCAAYQEVFGSPYVHQGGRDGHRLKALLSVASAERFTVETIVATAGAAMKRRTTDPFAKASKSASTLSGFCDNFNAIRAELAAAGGHANGHSLNGTTSRATPKSELRAGLDPTDFRRWLRVTYPKVRADLTLQTATAETVSEYVRTRQSN